MNIDLSGKTALVTGGSRGLGRAICERSALSGAEVVMVARRPEVLGTIRANQERLFPGRPVATRLATPDFQTLARAFGCPGFLIEREADVGPVLDRAFAALDGPVLVEVRSSIEAILPARS